MAVSSQEQKLAAENLYRDANTLIYGDNKPSEEAIDRVVGKINKECVFISTLPLCCPFLINLLLSASTRRANSQERGSTRKKAISLISTNTIGCSTKRWVSFVNLPIQVTLSLLPYRLRGTTTNIHQRFGPASSVARRCNPVLLRTGLSLIVFYTGFFIVMLDQAEMLSEPLAVFHPSKCEQNMH